MTRQQLWERYLETARVVALLAEQRHDIESELLISLGAMGKAFQHWQEAEEGETDIRIG